MIQRSSIIFPFPSKKKPQNCLLALVIFTVYEHHVTSQQTNEKCNISVFWEIKQRIMIFFQFQSSVLSLLFGSPAMVSVRWIFCPPPTSFHYWFISSSDWACLLLVCSVMSVFNCWQQSLNASLFILFLLGPLISVHVFCFGLYMMAGEGKE